MGQLRGRLQGGLWTPPPPSTQIGHAKTGAPVQASPDPHHPGRMWWVTTRLTWVSGAPARPRPGLEPPGPPGHGPQDPGHLLPPGTSRAFSSSGSRPLPTAQARVGAPGPQGAGQTALARPGRQRPSLPSCQGGGSGSWGVAGGVHHAKAPDQVPVFLAGMQAQCPQNSLPTEARVSEQAKQPPGRRGQRPGWSRPTFLSSVGVGSRVGRVPELRGGWGPALQHLPGTFRAECRCPAPQSPYSFIRAWTPISLYPGQHWGSVSLERASFQAPSQGKGHDQCWRGTLCLPPPTARARLLGTLGGWGEGRGVCCVIQAWFCQGCLESRPAWKPRAGGAGRAPPAPPKISVGGQTHETPRAGMSSAGPLHPQPQLWVRGELGPVSSCPSLCTGTSAQPGRPQPLVPPRTPGGPPRSTAPAGAPRGW